MIDSTLCYIEKDNKYLMLLRNKKKVDCNKGKWIGVGGKREPLETVPECLAREVLEETGLVPGEMRCLGVVHFRSDTWEDEEMYIFVCSDFTGEVVKYCPEGELAWIEEEKVMDLPMWEGDRLFIPDVLAGRDGIDLTVVYEGDRLASWSRGR